MTNAFPNHPSQVWQISPDEGSIRAELQAGHPVLINVGIGKFSAVGHFMVLAGLADDGTFILNDPNNLEAVYFLPFCNAMKTNLMTLEYAAAAFRQSLNTVFTAIGETDGEERVRRTYTELVFSNTLYFCSHQYHSAANAYPAIAKDPSMTVCFRAVNRGMQEIASIYAFLETTLRDRYPEDRELRGKVQKDELAFYDTVGKYIMKPIQLMKEKKRLKREMK